MRNFLISPNHGLCTGVPMNTAFFLSKMDSVLFVACMALRVGIKDIRYEKLEWLKHRPSECISSYWLLSLEELVDRFQNRG